MIEIKRDMFRHRRSGQGQHRFRKRGIFMQFTYCEKLPYRAEKRIFELLCDADGDFVPPLSSRESSTQSDFSGGGKSGTKPLSYFEKIKAQPTVLAEENGRISGFMSLIKDRKMNIGGRDITALYLSTLIVDRECRGRGISRQMYGYLIENFGDKNIVTRTWSSNAAHLSLLGKLGFSLLDTVKNDRGEGTDTVYYGRIADK